MRMLLLLFPAQVMFSLCRSCQSEMDVNIHSLAYDSIEMARKKGLFCPKGYFAHPLWVSDYLRYGYEYSGYRKKFNYLSQWAEDSYAGMYRDLKEEIQEIEEKLVNLHSWNRPDTKSIEHYEYFLEHYTSVLKEELTVLPKIQLILNQGLTAITRSCEQLYTLCIEKHNDQNSFYERSLTYYDQEKFIESVDDISKFLDTGQKIPNQDNPSNLYLAQGICYSDLGLYNQAIEALTEAIRIHPENREAYLERAAAFFEMGDFENSIQDFLSSDYHTTPIDSSLLDYAGGFIIGASSGFQEALTQFVPGLLNSAKGLSTAIWSLTIHPAQFSADVCNACLSFTKFLMTHSKPEILEAISPKLKTLVFDSDTLSMHEKGGSLGYLISKNGVELFGMVGAMKIAREMRRANMIMTLETLATSKPKVLEKSIAWGEKHLDEIRKMRADEAYVRTLRRQNLSDSTIRKTLHECGYETFSRPKSVPENFKVNFSGKNFGMEYIDPKNKHNSVRVMPGDPHSPNLNQQNPYVTQKKNGQYLDKNGKILKEDEIEFAHIPIEQFIFRE